VRVRTVLVRTHCWILSKTLWERIQVAPVSLFDRSIYTFGQLYCSRRNVASKQQAIASQQTTRLFKQVIIERIVKHVVPWRRQ